MMDHEYHELLYGDVDQFDYDEEPEEIPSGESPEGLGRANSHLRNILALKSSAANEEGFYRAEIERLQIRKKARKKYFDDAIAWHEGVLSTWHRHEVAAGRADNKRVTLAAGHVQLRASKEVVITDEDELRAWLSTVATGDDGGTAEELVYKTTETYMPSELNKIAKMPKRKKGDGLEPGSVVSLYTSDGEIVPGVQARIKPDTWSVSEG